MRMIDPGDLNKQITFLAPTTTQDGTGQPVITWNPVCTVWASIKPLSGKQLALAQANTITSTATHQIIIRWTAALVGQASYRISYAGGYTDTGTAPPTVYYRINSILDTEQQHVELRLLVTEVVA